MGELSPVHIAIVLVIVLLVFGPKKLPEMGRSLGKGIREFKDATSGLKDEVSHGLEAEPVAAAAPAATGVTAGAAAVTAAAPDAIATAPVAAAPVSVANAAAGTSPLFVASESDTAALAAYGIEADGTPIVDALAASATPPPLFVDANGNEYRLAAVAAASDADPEPLADSGAAAAGHGPGVPGDQTII